ncbi:tetratricopeptide repeat protein [Motiliproteus sp. SC1-56]|uniref:tetratricopeptide repeat protein n=1 Tax=Motiliproteus sp. SC1-56 TaxID=2799565 RepID=UPI001A8DF315|nr:tetratricopeptide repeat protein [Motiliproteus sp. SC1-56]
MPQITKTHHCFTLATGALTLALAGCASHEASPPPQATQTPKPAATAKAPPATTGSFKPATLYSLMVAEMAASRGLTGVSLGNYLEQAEQTRDLGVIKRALQLAGQARNREALLKAALLWIDVEPDNPTPYGFAATELILRGDREKALPMLEKVLEGDDLRAIDALANQAQQMSDEERAAYVVQIDRMLAVEPLAPLLYVKAVMIQHQGDIPGALALAQQALEQDPALDRAILLEADLQSKSGHLDTALGHLREELERRDHKQMRTLYTRLLLEKGQYPLAEQQADQLLTRYPRDHNLHFYLGALMLEHNQLDTSEAYFSSLAEQVGMSSTLHYYLGRIDQQQGEAENALEHYLQVTESTYFLPSYAEVVKILDQPQAQPRLGQIMSQARQQFPDAAPTLYALESSWLIERDFDHQAMALLDQALETHPDNVRLRYSRALLGEKQGDLELLESDLRYLLELDPDNATALNALGYSLTDHTDRHEEALALIERALAIKPDDPAILDSMGWAYYNLGNYDKALEYLQRAYNSFPDPEIATHLGKVYWALGKKMQAMQVWEEALEQTPDSPLLLRAIEEAGKTSARES